MSDNKSTAERKRGARPGSKHRQIGDEPRSANLNQRVLPADLERWTREAERAGAPSRSQWIIDTLNAACRN